MRKEKRAQKLKLHRETLRNLADEHLGAVAGGYSDYQGYCRTQIRYGCQVTTATQLTCPTGQETA
jgi:hypothetical protein